MESLPRKSSVAKLLLIAAAAALAGLAIYQRRAGDHAPLADSTARDTPSPATARSAPAPSSARTAPTTPSRGTAAKPPFDPATALNDLERALAETPPDQRTALLDAKLPPLIAHDPAAAARFAELQPDPLLREQLIRRVAQLWSASNADDAIAWVETLPASPEKQATLIDVALVVARGDPARAVQWREHSVGNQEADGVLEGLVQQWADRDFDAAIGWTSARPRNAQRDLILQRLVYVRAANGQPEAAARLADEAFADRARKADAVGAIAYQWALRDRDAAARWADSLDPELRARAANEIEAVRAAQHPPD